MPIYDAGLDPNCLYTYYCTQPQGCASWRVAGYDINWNLIFAGPIMTTPLGGSNYPVGSPPQWLVIECMDTGTPVIVEQFKVVLTWKDFMCCTPGTGPSYVRLKNVDTNRCIYSDPNNAARQWRCNDINILNDKRFDHCVHDLGFNKVRYQNRKTGKCLYFDTSSPNYAQIARYKNCASSQTKLRRPPITSSPPLIAISTFPPPPVNRQYLYGNPFNNEYVRFHKLTPSSNIMGYQNILNSPVRYEEVPV